MSTQTPNSGSAPNLIADRTYRNYDGPMRTVRAGWWVIAQSVIRTNVKKIGFWVTVTFFILLHLGLALLFYMTNNSNRVLGGLSEGRFKTDFTYSSCCYLGITESWFLTFIAGLVVGAGSIASDIQANALLVYLSRPLSRLDYLVGKITGVFLLLWGASAIPTLLLYLFLLTTYWDEGFIKQNPNLIFQVLLASIIAPLLNACLIIGISAWSKSSRVCGVVYASIFFLLAIPTRVAGFVLADNAYIAQDNSAPDAKRLISLAMTVEHSSIGGISDGLTQIIMKVKPTQNPMPLPEHKKRRRHPDLLPLLVLSGIIIILPVVMASRKVRAVEIISG
jgi:ABC-2 type transport system permease protein